VDDTWNARGVGNGSGVDVIDSGRLGGVGPVDADVQQHRERSRCRRLSRRHEQHWRFHPADKAALIQGGIPGPWLYFLVEITSAVVLGGIAVLFVPVFGAERLASTVPEKGPLWDVLDPNEDLGWSNISQQRATE
jgi:hypothetical protein